MNTGKMVFLLFITVIFTLTFVYIPYANIIFSSWSGLVLIYFVWYFLFTPKLRTLMVFGVFSVIAGFLFTLLGLTVFSEKAGEFFYTTMVLLFLHLVNPSQILFRKEKKK